jgi:hypothetical protein
VPGKIVNHFRILLAQKATKQQQNIAFDGRAARDGIAGQHAILANLGNRMLLRNSSKLCEYFDAR